MGTKELIRKDFDEAATRYNKLNEPESLVDGWKITGSIDVVDDEGSYWDTYEVNIFIPATYPNDLPLLVETGNKIKKEKDWHNSNGVCCLSTNAVMFSKMGGEVTLLKWLDMFAHPFLANHVYRLIKGHYANAEFAHGTEGIVQGYFKLLSTSSIRDVVWRLQLIMALKKIGRNDPCFCNNGKKYKHCFLKEPDKHKFNIPSKVLNDDLIEIIAYSKNEISKKSIIAI